MATATPFDERDRSFKFEVSVAALSEELQRNWGSLGREEREREFPQHTWVKEAMDAFVKLGLAQRTRNADRYLVRWRELRKHAKEIRDYFALHRGKEIDLDALMQLTYLEEPGEDRV